jgi:hypothetical protein
MPNLWDRDPGPRQSLLFRGCSCKTTWAPAPWAGLPGQHSLLMPQSPRAARHRRHGRSREQRRCGDCHVQAIRFTNIRFGPHPQPGLFALPQKTLDLIEIDSDVSERKPVWWLELVHPLPIFLVFVFLLAASAILGPEATVTVAGVFATVALCSAVIVANRLEPRPARRETSALFARLDWFGRYLIGALVLGGGIVLSISAQAVFDSAPTPGDGLSRVLEIATVAAVTWLIPVGALIVVGLISSDLIQSGLAGRRKAFIVSFPIPLSADRANFLGRIGGAMSDPRFVVPVLVIFISVQLATS